MACEQADGKEIPLKESRALILVTTQFKMVSSVESKKRIALTKR